MSVFWRDFTYAVTATEAGSLGRSMVKDEPLIRQVARVDPAIIRFDAPSAEGEAKT